jgi:hypothetical protein
MPKNKQYELAGTVMKRPWVKLRSPGRWNDIGKPLPGNRLNSHAAKTNLDFHEWAHDYVFGGGVNSCCDTHHNTKTVERTRVTEEGDTVTFKRVIPNASQCKLRYLQNAFHRFVKTSKGDNPGMIPEELEVFRTEWKTFRDNFALLHSVD